MKNKKKILNILGISAVIIILGTFFYTMTIPTVRYLPLTEREHFIFNPDSGDSIIMFEMNEGVYELQLYHYHFGELQESPYMPGPLGTSRRYRTVAFYSNRIDDTINFGMRGPGFSSLAYFQVELESPYTRSLFAQPVERIGRLGDGEYRLIAYYIGGGRVFTEAYFRELDLGASHIEDFVPIEHMVIITIERIEE